MELIDMDCTHDEPCCGYCAPCRARIAARKSEPEYQAHLKWARDVVSSDDPHHDGCNFWKMIFAARRMWRERHVIAWSCSQEAVGKPRCEEWCGWQSYCTATTRDEIDIAVASQSDGGDEHG